MAWSSFWTDMRRTFHALWNHLASLGLFGRGGSGTASAGTAEVTDAPTFDSTYYLFDSTAWTFDQA